MANLSSFSSLKRCIISAHSTRLYRSSNAKKYLDCRRVLNQALQRQINRQASSAFGVATVILAVDKANSKEAVDVCTDPVTVTPEISTEIPDPGMDSSYRLRESVVPILYNLSFFPDLKTGLFEGKVVVDVEINETSKEVKMNSKGLTIRKVYVDGEEARAEIDRKHEMLSITMVNGQEMQMGRKQITIEYTGDMKNRIVGLYISNYTNEAGVARPMATSKFEPTYARQAFPCFDEPNMKAKYKVHIRKPKDDPTYIALSNMPVEKEEPQGDGIMVHFQESVKMSTYLSCFIVCDFTYKETRINPTADNIPLRVYATPAQVKKTEYALKTAQGIIEYYLKYFNIPYPLPKLDLIAIPDFVSGAMEHWGLVTFRETALLYDEDKSSSANKQRIATVVSHELAHSWFGNLVTMNWWNDLWLNEGFASYIEYKGVDHVENSWGMLDQFLIEDLHPVLSLDATPASHPILKHVVTPDQITEIFDTITYNKGAALLRMLEGAVGETNFQKGVTAYLNKHKWGNAVTKDLWIELQEIVGESVNIQKFMDTWTIQMGYPILTIKEDNDKYVITQKRFLKDAENPGRIESSLGYKWTIPVTYITDKNQTNPVLQWLDYTESSITIDKPKDIKWIKFNFNQVGYYRVNYPLHMWKLLADNIENMESISDKTHLLEESFSIAESGNELDYSVALDMTKYLKNETNYIPWSVASTKLKNLKKFLVGSLQYSKFLNYVLSIVTPVYENLTWTEDKNDEHLRKRARITILNLACSLGHPECKKEAYNLFKSWLVDPYNFSLPQNLRGIIFQYGMEESGKEEWEKLLSVFKKEIDASEKLNLLKGLASVKESWLLRQLIELGKDETIIRGQDYFTMLQYVSANPIGTALVWDYVRENWTYLQNRFGLNDRYLGRLIPAITSSFCTKTKLKEIEAFFAEYPEAGAGAAAREEALTNARNNIKWMEWNKLKVEKWIDENAPKL